jgi:hypothetical protein
MRRLPAAAVGVEVWRERDAGEFALEVGGVAGAVLGVVEDGVGGVEDVPLGDLVVGVVGAESVRAQSVIFSRCFFFPAGNRLIIIYG